MARAQIPYVETVEDARVRGNAFSAPGKRALVQTTPNRAEVRVYCVSCGHPGGFVSEDIPGVIFLCDDLRGCGCDCQHTKGELPLHRLAL